MSDNNQALEMTDITDPLLEASQDLTMEDRDASLLLDSAERGQTRGKQRPPSISMVPRILRNLDVKSFIPQLVSIGPIHRETGKLKEFEWLKECYLNDLLNRSDLPKKTLDACVQKVKTKIPKIRESYADSSMKKDYDDGELARMMVTDGCFILEFCFKHEQGDNWYLQNKMQNLRIALDLILLENQVPFFVLQALFDCSMGEVPFTLSNVLDKYLAPYIKLFRSDLFPEKSSCDVLDKYVAPYIKLFRSLLPENFSTTDVASDLPKKNSTTNVHSDSSPAHVLGYLHKRYQIHEASKLVGEELAAKSWNHVDAEALRGHTIVELDRSGMNFKPHQEDDWSMIIKFQRPWIGSKSTLLMPNLVIDNFTELILRNFIAYEQSLPEDRYYFTSYAHAMDLLIDTREDIAKLVESKVLLNMLVSNQDAADMINNICKDMFVTDFYYIREFKQMDKYYNGFWPKITRKYFSNPWNAINLLVGTIVFLATVVSAIVAVLEYFP